MAIQRGSPDIDGGCHPQWNAGFKFAFDVSHPDMSITNTIALFSLIILCVTHSQPPKLTSCKVVSTTVTKLQVEGSWKYVIVMVRQSKKAPSTSTKGGTEAGAKAGTGSSKVDFYFMTIYDPRTATEYQCGIKPLKASVTAATAIATKETAPSETVHTDSPMPSPPDIDHFMVCALLLSMNA